MINQILNAIVSAGGNPLFVGGCVRDELLDLAPKDIDIEVFNINIETLISTLSDFGKVDQVGVSFGVIKLTTETDNFDFTLPRRDNKVGAGHKDFTVVVDHTMTTKEAAARRDFTINSISKHALDGYLIDPFNGIDDLNNQILRATSNHFVEDPLRVLRGFQFCGRFELEADIYTANTCSGLLPEYGTIAIERVHEEWKKWALKSIKPSKGLEFLVKSRWIELYPELRSLIGVPQDPEWHPEGDVWTHTMCVVDAAADIAVRDQLGDEDRLELIFGALCHDMGKPETTKFEDGRIRAKGHESVGKPHTTSFLKSIGFQDKFIKNIVPAVVNHMVACQKLSDRAVRRLSERVSPSSIRKLAHLIEADQCGRPPRPKVRSENLNHLIGRSVVLGVIDKKPNPIITGDDIVAAGIKQGPKVGEIYKAVYALQLKGCFTFRDEGLKILNMVISQH